MPTRHRDGGRFALQSSWEHDRVRTASLLCRCPLSISTKLLHTARGIYMRRDTAFRDLEANTCPTQSYDNMPRSCVIANIYSQLEQQTCEPSASTSRPTASA